ncbi:hypothetical protein F750_5485 [Streptomyces sp. PAMC 26508]|nr:hypothetical protein F750_5485 [Streptomyces sp. PAMC 26508]
MPTWIRPRVRTRPVLRIDGAIPTLSRAALHPAVTVRGCRRSPPWAILRLLCDMFPAGFRMAREYPRHGGGT